MTRPRGRSGIAVDLDALARMMPLLLIIDDAGHVIAVGPTLERIAGRSEGRQFFEMFDVRRPRGVTSVVELKAALDDPLHLVLKAHEQTAFRAVAVPITNGCGEILLNLSFGVGIAEAVRQHGLTLSDFAATDLAVEMLYLIEAKSAATNETRDLIARLEDARSDAVARSMTDALTGLPNRRGFEHHVLRLTDLGTSFAVMAIDLDHFKAVNDAHGHAVGDAVLKEAAARMSATLRQADIIARIGGDEFLAILRDVEDGASLNAAGERLIAAMTAPIVIDDLTCQIGASVGIAVAEGGACLGAGTMIDRADDALYQSKNAGRGVVTVSCGFT